MKIHITKTNGLNIDSMDVEISDQDLLKLGRRYFELASGNSEKETTFDEWKEKALEKDPEFKDKYMLSMARDLKAFCEDQSNCATCPFRKEVPGRGIYFCKLGGEDTKMFIPADWEV